MQTANSKTILVIDDDKLTLNLIRRILEQSGYRILTESVGENIFNILEHNIIDLILLDIKMPGLDGHQLCSLLKGRQDYENIPVIFLSALTDQENISKGFAVGAVDYITKPFLDEELLARINVYLSLREKNKELYIRKGSLLVCSNCGNVRDKKNWMSVIEYLEQNLKYVIETQTCPSCDSETEHVISTPPKIITNNEKQKKQSKILIVDDEPESLHVLERILSQKDYETITAESGKNVLNLLKQNQPDLILLDIMMPDMDGFQVCQEIKNNEQTSSIPVLFITALADSTSIIKGFEVGANDFIKKPFHINEVLARVNAQLEFKRLWDRLNLSDNSIRICGNCNRIKLFQENWIPFDKMYGTFGPSILSYTVCPQCINQKYKPFQ